MPVAGSSAESVAMLCTAGFVNDVVFSRHGANGPESSTTLYFNEVRQVKAPVGRQTTSVWSSSWGAKLLSMITLFYLACSAKLPTGLYILPSVISFFLTADKLYLRIH